MHRCYAVDLKEERFPMPKTFNLYQSFESFAININSTNQCYSPTFAELDDKKKELERVDETIPKFGVLTSPFFLSSSSVRFDCSNWLVELILTAKDSKDWYGLEVLGIGNRSSSTSTA